ncbi:hypothetical protein V8G54_010264 [Vigna mungo]|uniref:Uncharacterized protein n=1 Tax=Vigna mungo TaxID=3915 RepID=A0AAQ3S4Q0_VIGMU
MTMTMIMRNHVFYEFGEVSAEEESVARLLIEVCEGLDRSLVSCPNPFYQGLLGLGAFRKPPNEWIAREVLDAAARIIQPGVTTDEIDRVVHEATIVAVVQSSRYWLKGCCTGSDRWLNSGTLC